MSHGNGHRLITTYADAQDVFSARRRSGTGHAASCQVPGHGKGRGDANPSLTVWERDDGSGVKVQCKAGCSEEDVLAAYGLSSWRDLLYEDRRVQRATEPAPSWPPRDAMEAFDARDLLATRFPVQRWAVPGLLPPGVGLLVAKPKEGKSWLALAVALGVAIGGQALGTFPTERGRVLLLALEDGPRRVQDRLQRLVGTEQLRSGDLTIRTVAPRVDEGLIDLLDEWVVQGEARLVVIDVLAQIRPLRDGRGRANAYAEDYAALSPIRRWANRHGVSVLIVHHTKKGAEKDPLDTISGTTGLAGVVDYLALLNRPRGESVGRLFVVGRDVEDVDLGLTFEAGRWSASDIPARLVDSDTTPARAYRLLREQGMLTTAEVAASLSVAEETAKKALQRLAEKGDVQRPKRQGGKAGSWVPYMSPASVSPPSPRSPVSSEQGDSGDTGDTEDGGDGRDGYGCVLCERTTFRPQRLHLGCEEVMRAQRRPDAEHVLGTVEHAEVAPGRDATARQAAFDFQCALDHYDQHEDPATLARLAEPCPEMHDTFTDPAYDVPPLALWATESGHLATYLCSVCGYGWTSHHQHVGETVA